jgi:uncharacterized repeat protein (TIGR01451 family)
MSSLLQRTESFPSADSSISEWERNIKPTTINLGLRTLLRAVCLLVGIAWAAPSTFAATMQVAGTNVITGANFSVPLSINSGTNTLGGYTVTVSFNANVLQFMSVLGGNGQFAAPPATVNTTVPGQVRYVHQQTVSITSPTGTVVVSRFSFSAIGAVGGSSVLAISNASADNTDGMANTVTNITDGLVNIITPPHLMVTPSSRDYGAVTVGLTNTLPFSVINTGDLALTGTVATASPFAISGANSYTVQPGQTGTVQVSFIPTGAGTFSNSVVFSSNGGVSTNAVMGMGVVAGHIAVNPASLDFGTIAAGTTSQRVFVVSNAGGTTIINGTATVGAPFAIIAGQQFSVPALGATNVTVQFAPGGAGAFTGQVVFATANGGGSTNPATGAAASAPAASFTAASTNGAAPLVVNFADSSSGTITNRLWSFGDTGTSTLASPSHTYSNAGVFSVSLTVFGPGGSSMTNAPNLITVTNVLPVAGFTANPTNGAAQLLVMFTDASTGTIANRFWTFGDGATSGGIAPTHTYMTAGVFSVSVTVSGPTGSDTLDRPDLITVTNLAPMAVFTASPTNGGTPLLVNFTDASTGTITNRQWDFGDGGSSTAVSPSHTYTNAGSYSVTLMVFGPAGTDSLTRPGLIIVTNAPVSADLEVIKIASPSLGVVGSNLTYTITVTNLGPDTATSITLTDALPASVSFVFASDECTNNAGLVVCDLGSLTSGAATNVTVVVVPTLEGSLTNVASVGSAEADPNPTNNTATAITEVFNVPPPPHDLAVVKLKAPKKVALSAKTPSKVGKFKVTIQNLGPESETIPDLATLEALVTANVETLGTNCASFVATLVPPNKSFPLIVAPNKKLSLKYQATFDCANDPEKTTKTEDHNDFETMVVIDLSALGEVDTKPSNDTCPRPPNGSDPGCGNKDKATKQLGAPVFTDVIVK